jgi:S1-C subfamily serine protease
VAGSAVAVVASLVAIWFIALNLANGPFPSVATEIRGSAVVRTLDAALPQPPSLLAEVRGLFNRFGFPDVFSGIPPLPADPVQPPSQEEARAAIEAAASSTVQVIGPACDVIQEGSGFVAAEGYIVTNAHVVAGMDDPEVRSAVGGTSGAQTVLFDPDLDLAVLAVAETPGLPLSLAAQLPERGAPGAVLGYPQGGPLDAHRAAVRRTIDAVGRDIYGQGEVERLVLELQTVVRPGNSGGPFVLSDGRVGGVVFAASSGDEDIGYAIAAPEVGDVLRSAVGRTAEVDTGPCID